MDAVAIRAVCADIGREEQAVSMIRPGDAKPKRAQLPVQTSHALLLTSEGKQRAGRRRNRIAGRAHFADGQNSLYQFRDAPWRDKFRRDTKSGPGGRRGLPRGRFAWKVLA